MMSQNGQPGEDMSELTNRMIQLSRQRLIQNPPEITGRVIAMHDQYARAVNVRAYRLQAPDTSVGDAERVWQRHDAHVVSPRIVKVIETMAAAVKKLSLPVRM